MVRFADPCITSPRYFTDYFTSHKSKKIKMYTICSSTYHAWVELAASHVMRYSRNHLKTEKERTHKGEVGMGGGSGERPDPTRLN